MKFRIGLPASYHLTTDGHAHLLSAVCHATGLEASIIELRLAEPLPWLMDVEDVNEAERTRMRLEQAAGCSLSCFPVTEEPVVESDALGLHAQPTELTEKAAEPPRPPPIRRGPLVAFQKLEAPPRRTQWLFLLLLVVGGIGVVLAWRDWYAERATGAVYGMLGPHGTDQLGNYAVIGGGEPVEFARQSSDGKCETDPTLNPMGCAPPLLFNGGRALELGRGGDTGLVVSMPELSPGAMDAGQFELSLGEDTPLFASSAKPRCERWLGNLTIHSLMWRERPRARRHERYDVRDLSIAWDLRCADDRGVRSVFRGCFSHEVR